MEIRVILRHTRKSISTHGKFLSYLLCAQICSDEDFLPEEVLGIKPNN